MKRRINYTGRKRIEHAKTQLELVEQPGKPMRFVGHLDLTGLDLPETAHVIVEAYHKESTQRFECGTVGHIQFPDDTTLTEVDVAGSYLFRVKVVDREGNGSKLLATAEKIQPKEPNEPDGSRDFLLKVLHREDTGGIPWKLEMDPDGDVKPILVINTKVTAGQDKMRTSPVFRGLILPAAIREVLNFIFLTRENEDPEEGSWQTKWLSFAAAVTNGDTEVPTSDDPDIPSWINDVVSGFSTRHALCEKLALAEEVTSDA